MGRLRELNIKNDFQKRLVDDITIIPSIIPKGWKLENGELKFSKSQEDLDNKEGENDDARTMKIIQKVANNIDDQFKVTFDVPSNHKDGRVPILDVKVAINKDNRVDYVFYKKPMASDKVVLRSSAMSYRQKITTLTQEVFRRLHNTSDKIHENVKIVILNQFMETLVKSGYNEAERLTILRGGINTFEKLKKKEADGERPFYRSVEFKKNQNVNNVKRKKSSSWFKRDKQKYATVMFVEATEGDKLLKMLKETEDKFRIDDNIRIKLVSKTGPKLVQMFHKKDPFKMDCGESDCVPCTQSIKFQEDPPNCRKNNVAYMAQCRNCESKGSRRIYYGETSRNLYLRSKEHYSDVSSKKEKSWIFKHIKKEHNSELDKVEFKWKVIGAFKKPLTRQITEAVKIRNNDGLQNLNTKHEFNAQRINKIVIEESKPKPKFYCCVCGHISESEAQKEKHEIKFHRIPKCEICNTNCYGEWALQDHVKNMHNTHEQK